MIKKELTELTDKQISLLTALESLLDPHIEEDIDCDNSNKEQIKYYYQNILYDALNLVKEVKDKTFDIDSEVGEIEAQRQNLI